MTLPVPVTIIMTVVATVMIPLTETTVKIVIIMTTYRK